MISNERVRKLIACDRETLIDLMAVALANGFSHTYPADPDIRSLIDAARRQNAQPQRGGVSLERWNTEMSTV